MTHSRRFDVVEMLERCGTAGLLDDPLGRSIAMAHERGYATEFDHEQLIRLDAKRERDEQLGLLPPFALPRGLTDGVPVAQNVKGNVIRVPAAWFSGHMCIAGSTGAGKTTWGLFLLLALMLSVPSAGFVLVDSFKKQFRGLRAPLRCGGRELVVVRGCKRKSNILDPDGCDPRGYLPVVTELLSRELDLPSLASIELGRAIFRAYDNFGVFDRKDVTEWPCLFDVYRIIYDNTALNHASREVLLSRLAGLLLQLTPACAAYRRTWRQSDLDQLPAVVELGGVATTVRRLTISHLLASTMHRRCELGLGSDDPNLFIALDDAQRFLSRTALGIGLNTFGEQLGLVRGAGVCLLALFQSFHGVDPAILANLNTLVLGRFAAESDWQHCARQLGLNQDQLAWARRELGPGTMLMRLAHGPCREPFPIKTSRLQLPPAPTDDEADATLAALAHIPVIPAAEYANWSPIPRSPAGKAPKPSPAPEPSPTAAQTFGLDDAELRFLAAVVDAPPMTPSSALPKLAGLSPKRARQIRARLAQLGLIEETKVQAGGGAGRPTLVIQATKKGQEITAAWHTGKGPQS